MASGCEVTVVMHASSDPSRLDGVRMRLKRVMADLSDPEAVTAVVRSVKPTVVFHSTTASI